MQLKNRLVLAAKDLARKENLSLVLIPAMSKQLDEQLKLSHKAFDVVDRSNRKICVSLLWYNVDKPETSYAQVQLSAKNKQEEIFQEFVYVKLKLK